MNRSQEMPERGQVGVESRYVDGQKKSKRSSQGSKSIFVAKRTSVVRPSEHNRSCQMMLEILSIPRNEEALTVSLEEIGRISVWMASLRKQCRN